MVEGVRNMSGEATGIQTARETPPRLLQVVVGTPLDFECPLCGKPKGAPCYVKVREGEVVMTDCHLDRKKLTRVLHE